MKTRLFFIALTILIALGSCKKRSTCATYQEVGAFGIPDENYEPSNYIIVQRNKKTGKVRKVQYASRAEKSRLFRKEKKFIKDKELFPDVKDNKKPKKSKKSKKSQDETRRNRTPNRTAKRNTQRRYK